MRYELLLSALLTGTLAVQAQTTPEDEYADAALRSPVVAVEFTGQRCRYCPDMARALKANQERYGKENYIITALHHLSDFSSLPGKHVSLFHPEAEKYAASIDIHSGLPQLAYNTLGPTVSDLYLDQMFQEPDLLECTGTVSYTQDKHYVIDLQTRLRRDRQEFVEGKQIDILFWALENDIVAFQDDNGKNTYPAHQHIFRGSINGTWGEPYEIGTHYSKTWKIPQEVLEDANTEVVVFFLDHDTRTILDAGQFKAIPGSPTGIDTPQVESEESTLYDLSGKPVTHPVKGQVYIQNRRKIVY